MTVLDQWDLLVQDIVSEKGEYHFKYFLSVS